MQPTSKKKKSAQDKLEVRIYDFWISNRADWRGDA